MGDPPEASYDEWKSLALLLQSGRAPEGIVVEGDLSLAKLRLRSLPPAFTVRGDLDLRQNQRLRRIGDGLNVAGNLLIGGWCQGSPVPWWENGLLKEAQEGLPRIASLAKLSRDSQCPLVELPRGSRVGLDLQLRSCHGLERLPDDLHVGRSVLLAGCPSLTTLPDSFTVHGDLEIWGAPRLKALPSRLQVKGNLKLFGVGVELLPENLRVGRDLTLECCGRLTQLPERLEVGRTLVVRCCPITRLPSDLRVGKHIRIQRARHLRMTPEGMSAPGYIELAFCDSLVKISPGLRLGLDLVARDCRNLRDLPADLEVPGELDLHGCTGLEQLPRGLRVGIISSALSHRSARMSHRPALRLSHCSALRSLPEDLEVSGPIEVGGSGLTDLPDRLMKSVRLLWRNAVVPPEVVFRPETITPAQILGERNAELRRIMLERVGLDEVLKRANAVVLDSDTDAGGDRRLFQVTIQRDTRVFLQCSCPSTGRQYLLRVPPITRTCRHAAAWMAGFEDPEEYRPIVET
jgi:hypothetical protein